ncbi:MAG: hypothetical protein ABSH34_02550 [Verrucomicrobiota bacterium]
MKPQSCEPPSYVRLLQANGAAALGAGNWTRRALGLTGMAAKGAYGRAALVAWSASLLLLTPAYADPVATGGEGYIRSEGARWTLGAAGVEKIVALEDGRFLLRSFKSTATGQELAQDSAPSDEFFVLLGDKAERVSGATGGWQLVGSKTLKLKQTELQLDVTLQRESLQVTKSYVVYPKSSIIREWVTFKNTGTAPLKIGEPGFLNFTSKPGSPSSLEFLWMTGGENAAGSWTVQTETLPPGKARTFDSYEPMKVDLSQLPGDGVNAKILLNNRQVWPDHGWQYLPHGGVTARFDLSLEVAVGDQLVFLVNMNKHVSNDTTTLDPTITYPDGEKHTASAEFGTEQGQHGWRYQYLQGDKFMDLICQPTNKLWAADKDNPIAIPIISPGTVHPGPNQDVARVWTAPKAGHIKVTGSLCNTGNPAGGEYGFRAGSSTYAPWYALYSRETKQGLFIGWDYFGHWGSSFALGPGGAVQTELKVAGHRQTLGPDESITTPKAFVGLYRDDLDNAGNECLDWQYRYLWDYTRRDWFPAMLIVGCWTKGTTWGKTWSGGGADFDSTYRKVFRVADLMRFCGGDVYHRDWGWWGVCGDWDGPDWRSANQYLHKYGMGLLLYGFIYAADPDSRVGKAHRDWFMPDGRLLDLTRPEVVQFMEAKLDEWYNQWGPFEWRNDGGFTEPRQGPTGRYDDDSPLLGQDQGLRKVIQDFLDKHQDCSFQPVNGGGVYGSYEYSRFASTFSFSDGAVGIIRNYWASLLLPPDKTSDIPETTVPENYNKAAWRGYLCLNFGVSQDSSDPVKLDGVREMIDIYHYLSHEGVVGRWVKVYRPAVQGDDPTMYFQRLSGDRQRGIIIPKRAAPGPVTIKPKGLLARNRYLISFQESQATDNRTGADLMANGIRIEKALPGDLVYLNLPMHPGSKLDTQPPRPPSNLTKRQAQNMGYPGVELAWKPGKDNNWISYYEIFRNGAFLDKLAKGTFYFDHSAGADLAANYEVRSVDGAGNVSGKVPVSGPAAQPAKVLDDAPGSGIEFAGDWQRQTGIAPAYAGTLTRSNQKGAAAELAFEGRKVLWFTKLGADCGKAEVSIDGAAPEVVDTYSADDIWGICLYQHELPSGGKHTLRIKVLGQHAAHPADYSDPASPSVMWVHVDGVRVEP